MGDDVASPPLRVLRAGVVPHAEVAEEMRRLQRLRIDGAIPDTLILVEHPEVVTIGPKARRDGFTVGRRMPTVDVDRGGGITWHGPGQLVAYPIIEWRFEEQSVPGVIERLEAWIISALAECGVESYRDSRMQGVWVDEHKVASVGLSFFRWVSRHGVSINIDTPAGRVESVGGCGLAAGTTTSLAALQHTIDASGERLSRHRLERALLAASEENLGRQPADPTDVSSRPPWSSKH